MRRRGTMARVPATPELDLPGASTVTTAGVARAPLPIRAGRVGNGTSTRAHRLNLDGQLVFPGRVNAHDHLHVNAVPPMRMAGKFRSSYERIEAIKARFAEPRDAPSFAMRPGVGMGTGGLKTIQSRPNAGGQHATRLL